MNYSEFILKEQALRGVEYDQVFIGALIITIILMFSMAIAIFFTFTEAMHYLMKYIAVFEKDEMPFTQ